MDSILEAARIASRPSGKDKSWGAKFSVDGVDEEFNIGCSSKIWDGLLLDRMFGPKFGEKLDFTLGKKLSKLLRDELGVWLDGLRGRFGGLNEEGPGDDLEGETLGIVLDWELSSRLGRLDGLSDVVRCSLIDGRTDKNLEGGTLGIVLDWELSLRLGRLDGLSDAVRGSTTDGATLDFAAG